MFGLGNVFVLSDDHLAMHTGAEKPDGDHLAGYSVQVNCETAYYPRLVTGSFLFELVPSPNVHSFGSESLVLHHNKQLVIM